MKTRRTRLPCWGSATEGGMPWKHLGGSGRRSPPPPLRKGAHALGRFFQPEDVSDPEGGPQASRNCPLERAGALRDASSYRTVPNGNAFFQRKLCCARFFMQQAVPRHGDPRHHQRAGDTHGSSKTGRISQPGQTGCRGGEAFHKARAGCSRRVQFPRPANECKAMQFPSLSSNSATAPFGPMSVFG